MTMHFAPGGAQARASALLRTVPMSLWPQAVRDRRARLAEGLRRLEDLRDEMIGKLDELTADPDLEPSLGLPEHPHHLRGFRGKAADIVFRWDRGSNDDREEECEDEGAPTGDDEPDADGERLLGWSEGESLTGRLGLGSDDCEPDCDAEPEDFS